MVNLATHRLAHTREKPFTINVRKDFNNRMGLIRHRRIHTGDKSFINS